MKKEMRSCMFVQSLFFMSSTLKDEKKCFISVCFNYYMHLNALFVQDQDPVAQRLVNFN